MGRAADADARVGASPAELFGALLLEAKAIFRSFYGRIDVSGSSGYLHRVHFGCDGTDLRLAGDRQYRRTKGDFI